MLRIILWGLFWLAIASWLIKNPQQAGQDVSHLFAWLSYAVGQLGKFIGAI